MTKLKRLVKILRKYEPEKIILFGSAAREEPDEYSDLDLVIIKKTRKRFIKRLVEVAKLIDSEIGRVDVFVYTPKEFEEMCKRRNPFIEKVIKEGKVLYTKKYDCFTCNGRVRRR